MPRKLFDPYAALGVPPTATPDEIRRSYLRQVRVHHPDTRPTQQSMPFADEQLRRVLAAYALLRDPQRRARYDHATKRHDRAAKRGSSAPGAPAGASNAPNSAGNVRIPGLTVRFRVKWLSG
jgi:curved DNA-binding protein CbpA